jgi:hypothetical protein
MTIARKNGKEYVNCFLKLSPDVTQFIRAVTSCCPKPRDTLRQAHLCLRHWRRQGENLTPLCKVNYHAGWQVFPTILIGEKILTGLIL